jgi:hypothetical protein
MSVLPNRGRLRWSAAGALAALPAVMAGRSRSRPIVWVEPPLFARLPSRASSGAAIVPVRSAPVQMFDTPSRLPIRLLPPDVKTPAMDRTSGPWLFPLDGLFPATIVLVSDIEPLFQRPPPPWLAPVPATELLLTVELVSDTVALDRMPPPSVTDAFPLIVQFRRVADPL